MLNFKQFLSNAAAFINGTNDTDPSGQLRLPLTTVEIPTISTSKPVTVFKITKKGKAYQICAEDNISWYIPGTVYHQLLSQNKAPKIGDKLTLEFYKDGNVKTFKIIN